MRLQDFQRGVSKFLAVLLFAVLILSFALWGIPNYTRDSVPSSVARVGKTDISSQEFSQLLDQQRNRLSEAAKQPLSRESARVVYKLQTRNMAADLDRDVLYALIDQAAIDEYARSLGINFSDETIVEQIRSDPAFQDNGQFSRARYDEFIRGVGQRGFSERRYFADRRTTMLRDAVEGSLRASVQPPGAMVDIIHKYREETRTVAYVTLDPDKVKIEPPDDAKLKELYERIKRQFSEPERRKVTALLLTRDDLKERSKVEDVEVNAAWEADKLSWDIPERRRIQQIQYKTKGEAATAAAEIATGKSFLMAALDANGMQGRTDSGLVSRREIPDAKLAAVVFSLQVNTVSEPVETRNGALLVRVTEISPARSRTLAEVAPDIRANLEQSKERDAATRMQEQIDDLRAQKKSLKDIGAELKLKVVETPAVDRQGKAADGKTVTDLPDAEKILGHVFEPEKAAGDRDAIELPDGGLAWAESGDVTPAKQKAFEEVREDVKKQWTDAETRKALAAAGEAVVERLKKGEMLEVYAGAEKIKVEPTKPFKRGQPVSGLSSTGERLAFTLPKGGAGSVESPDGKSRTVFVVTEVKPADAPSKEQSERLREELRWQYQSDAVTTFTAALRDKIGYSIDEAAYKRLIGSDAAN